MEERQFDQPVLADAVALAMRSRPDLQSLALQKEAQNTAVRSAWSAFGPQISTFGSWETDRPSFAGSGGNNWMAGAELRINLLPVAQREKLAAARIGQRQVEASSAAAEQQIRLEVTRAWYEHQSATQMLDVARTATAQADENLRILKNRYEAGLATITDLLRAEDTQRQSRANYWQAVFQNTSTFANLKFATGTLTPSNVGDLQ
jgi:outer membrane protein TolC